MILYYIFALLAISAGFHLYRRELLTGLGVNLSNASYDSGSESAQYMVTLNSAKTALEAGDGGAAPQNLLDAKANKDSTTLDFAADGNFTAGSMRLTRSGDQVTASIITNIEFSSTSNVTTASNIVPSGWRPTDFSQENVYSVGNEIQQVGFLTTGRVQFIFRNSSFALSNRTSTGTSVSITYNSVQ